MDGTAFLRTVRIGGFDKKDVCSHIDFYHTVIFMLEKEIERLKNQNRV
jgi:hypothetical protein